MIHVIGDSHSAIFSGRDMRPFPQWPAKLSGQRQGFDVHHLGPALAYNLGAAGHWSQMVAGSLLSTFAPGAPVVLVFGEIDCRTQLTRRAEGLGLARTKEVVYPCVERYLLYAQCMAAAGFKPVVWAVLPSARDGVHECSDFPAAGTSLRRNEVTMLFNEVLAERCRLLRIACGCIFEKLLAPGGLNNEEFYGPDRIHLNRKALPMIDAELQRVIGEG